MRYCTSPSSALATRDLTLGINQSLIQLGLAGAKWTKQRHVSFDGHLVGDEAFVSAKVKVGKNLLTEFADAFLSISTIQLCHLPLR